MRKIAVFDGSRALWYFAILPAKLHKKRLNTFDGLLMPKAAFLTYPCLTIAPKQPTTADTHANECGIRKLELA